MDFPTLKALLQKYFSGDTFALPATNDLDSTSISKAIAGCCPVAGTEPTLTITGITTPPSSDHVIVKGQSVLIAGQAASYAVEADFWIIAEAPVMTVTTTSLGAASWSFADSFTALAGTAIARLRFDAPLLILASTDSTTTGASAVYSPGLNFNGTPNASNADSPLQSLAWLLPDLDQMLVSGGIGLVESSPVMSLAAAGQSAVGLGPVSVAVGIALSGAWLPSSDTPKSYLAQAFLTATIVFGQGPSTLQIPVRAALTVANAPLLAFDMFGTPVPIDSFAQLDPLAAGAGSFAALVPAELPSSTLSLSALSFVVSPSLAGTPVMINAGVSLDPATPWTVLPGILDVTGLSVQLSVLLGTSDGPSIDAIVAGSFVIGDSFEYQLAIAVPDLVLTGALAPESSIPAGDLLDRFIGSLTGPIVGLPPLTVFELDLTVDVRGGTYAMNAEISDLWSIDLGVATLEMQQVVASVFYGSNQLLFNFQAYLAIDDDAGNELALLIAQAENLPGGGWSFSIGTQPGDSIDLVQITKRFLPADVYWPPFLPQTLAMTELLASVNTATLDYTAQAVAAATWELPIDDLTFSIVASLDIASTAAPTRSYSGTVSGELTILSFAARVSYTFGTEDGNDTLTFQISFRGATLQAVKTTNAKGQPILTVSVSGVTFGDLVEYLAGLVDPSLGFQLPSPWDVLNQLSLDGMSLVVNLTTKDVGFTYPVNADLGFIDVGTIGLTYLKSAGGEPTVEISITGSFFAQDYTADSPLQWDLLNDTPPAPPGAGSQLLDLRYLGIGQNVGFRDATSFTTVQQVIAALEQDFLPAASNDSNPLPALPATTFTGDGRWLVGADFTLMSAISLAAVFNDPALYGLRIALAGDKAGQLSGLDFEILYKRITDTLGVYQLELTLPAAMRQMQFGAVSVTAPVIGLDIYTNGDFRIDFGFPTGGDFSRSFSVQAGIFVGYGGFYLAVLDGATSAVVPAITNGTFSPVIEFGLGLSVGVGRTVDKGILSGGLTVTVGGVVEGALAWFNPNDSSAGTPLFYRIQGTASLTGKLYGSVDFVVIKADVSVVVFASFTLLAESYQPIEITLSLGVEVTVSLRVLFIRVHFSFSTALDLSFEIGSASTPPWQIAAVDASERPFLLRQQRSRYRRRPLTPSRVYALRRAAGPQTEPDWTPRNVFGLLLGIELSMLPALTVAAPPGVTPAFVQVVMALFAENSIDPDAFTAAEVRRLGGGSPGAAPFDLLVQGIFLWSLAAMAGEGAVSETVTAGLLDELSTYLGDPLNRDEVFTYDRLTSFLVQNYHVTIGTPQPFDQEAQSGTIFPMIPELQMAPAGLPPVQFWNTACVGATYREELATYYDQMRVDLGAATDAVPRPVGPRSFAACFRDFLPAGCTGGTEPLSSVIFCDYFAMIASGVADAARTMLAAYPYQPTGLESIDQIVEEFGGDVLTYATGRGDTLATIAGRFGVTVAELRRRNPHLASQPGSRPLPGATGVAVGFGVTVESLAEANDAYPLNWGGFTGVPGPALLTLDGVQYQIQSDDTLLGIAQHYGFTGPQPLFVADGPTGPGTLNTASTQILQPGATIPIAPIGYVVEPGDMIGGEPLLRVGACYYVRAGGGPEDPAALPWYAQRIANMLGPSGFTGTVMVPLAATGALGLEQVGATAYTLKPGDTIDRVASYFDLIQLESASGPFVQFVDRLSAPPDVGVGSVIGIPALGYPVGAGDSVASVATDLLVPVSFVVDSVAGATGALQPLGVVVLPTIDHQVRQGDTLGSVAAAFDLTVDDLAESVRGNPGIFAPYDAAVGPLTLPNVASRPTGALVSDMIADGRFNSLSAMVTRFLLNGMRVPQPGAPPWEDPELFGLYATLGQQFAVPFIGPLGLDVVFTKGPSAWFDFPSPDAPLLVVSLGPTFLAENAPSTTFSPEILYGPTAMPLAAGVPPRYALEQTMHWQSAESLAVGATGIAGQPSLWFFPETLLTVAAAAGATATPPYELVTAPAAESTTNVTPLDAFAWAMAVELRLQQIPSLGGAPMPNSYVVAGVDAAARELLLSAFSLLPEVGSPGDRLFVLYPPGSFSANPGGLASMPLDAAATFVLKTNLSTTTSSNQIADFKASLPSGTYWAGIAAVQPFLQLVWEASITGSGGFYLNYVEAGSGNGLPEALFASGPETTVTLVLLLAAQSGPDAARGLFAFNNCTIVTQNVDASVASLFAQLESPTADDLVPVPTVPPGVVGFRLARTNPGPGPTGTIDPLQATQSLYNVLGYAVAENANFAASHQGLPIGPVDGSQDDWGVAGLTGAWRYQQVIPIATFGLVNDTPSCPALPPAAANPYAGITGPAPLSSAEIHLAFHDVYGNSMVSDTPVGPVSVEVGYTDEILGVGAWPGAALAYSFVPAGATGVALDAALSLQVGRYVASTGNPYAQSFTAATAAAGAYGRLFYQVQQRDLGFALSSSLGVPAIAGDELKAAMSAFVTKAVLTTGAASQLVQTAAPTADGLDFDTFAATYGVTPGDLAAANAGMPVATFFAGTIVLPAIVAGAPGISLAQLAAGEIAAPWPPRCNGGSIGPIVPLTAADIATQNPGVPLAPGATLRTSVRQVTLPDFALGTVPDTIAGVAAWLQCNVYLTVTNPDDPNGPPLEIGLLADNLTATGIITAGLTITLGGVTVTTDSTTTLQSLRSALQLPDLASFAVSGIAGIEGFFVSQAQISTGDFVVPAPPPTASGPGIPQLTLADLPAGSGTPAALGTANALVSGFFAPGASVFLTYTCAAPRPGDTLQSLADGAKVTVAQLGSANAATRLRSGASLTIPNLTFFDPDQERWSPYSATADDSLSTIAARFGAAPLDVASLNRELPGLFAPGSVTVRGTPFAVAALDSLQSLFARVEAALGLTFEQFVDAIAATTGIYRTNGVFVAPAAFVPAAASTGESLSLTALAAAFNLTEDNAVADLLAANQSLQSFLQEGAEVSIPGRPPLTVGAHDTVNTLLARLDGATLSDFAGAVATQSGLLSPVREFLLPPAPASIASAFAPQIPPPGATGEQAVIFPATVTVTMARPIGLVATALRDNRAVFESSTRVAPAGMSATEGAGGLTPFALAFEQAFAAWALKCAVSRKTAVEGDTTDRGEIYAVNFGSGGVTRFDVLASQPELYAVAPLSTSLLTQTVPVRPYTPGSGLGTPVEKTFDNADVDAWLQSFLGAVDLVLSPQYAIPAFRMEGATGPGSPYDAIAGAKGSIAGNLAAMQVSSILDVPGATAGVGLAIAQETMLQQMLVRLGSAYDIDAVVQFPVDIASPFVTPPPGSTASGPPQASGSIVPPLFVPSRRGLAGNRVSLGAVAAAAGVSAAYLAEILAVQRGVLAQGASVTFGTLTLEIGANDTIASVAAAFGLSFDLSDPTGWKPWVDFVAVLAGQALIGGATPLPLTLIARTIAAGDSLDLLAEFVDRDAASVARAAQDVPNVFVAGKVIDFGRGRLYTVVEGDTIWHIVATVDPAWGVTVDSLADAVSDRTDLLAPGQLSFATLLPQVAFSPAKIALGPVGAPLNADNQLSFFVTVKNESVQRKLFLNLSYVINEIEYGIVTVPGTDYPASSWLTFVLPIGASGSASVPVQSTVPQVQVPLPLRAYPNPALLLGQVGVPTDPGATTIDGAKLWSYGFDFQRQNAAQDTNYVQVTFSDGGGPTGPFAPSPSGVSTSLFTALAEFADAWPTLQNDLGILPTLTGGANNEVGAVAVQTMATMAQNVAANLPVPDDLLLGGGPSSVYLYQLRTESDGEFLRNLFLTLEEAPTGPVWPEIWLASTTGFTGGSPPNVGFVPVPFVGATGDVAHYDYPADVPDGPPLTHRFWMNGRDVIVDNRAAGGVFTTRNQDLIGSGPLGPTGPTTAYPTSAPFVYQTPLVQFIDPLVPLLSNPTLIDVSTGKRPLSDQVAAMLGAVLEVTATSGTAGTIDLLCSYAYPVAGGGGALGDALLVQMPVRLAPSQVVTPADLGAFASGVANSLASWARSHAPLRGDALFLFQVTVYTAAPAPPLLRASRARRRRIAAFGPGGGAASTLQPVLRLENLYIPLTNIIF